MGRSHVYLDPDVAAFIKNQEHLGDTVTYYLNPVIAYEEINSFWEIYVDETPNAAWPHTMEMYTTSMLQDDFDNVHFTYRYNVVFDSGDELGNYQKFSSYPYGNKCNLKPSVSVSNITNDAANNTYAIIMGGGTNKYNNYEEYWNDCSFMYQTLVNRFKIPKANIRVYLGAGTDTVPTIRRADMQGFMAMPMDLDNDGISDINGPSNTSLFINELFEINLQSNADKSHVFVFFVDKGGVFVNNDSITPTIQFWGADIVPYGMWYNHSFLTDLLPNLRFNSLNIFFGQECSGVFAQKFMTKMNTLNPELSRVFTASSQGANPFCSDKPYHEFVYNWLCALNEKDIHQNNSPLPPFPVIPQNNTYDSNGDCQITMNEAYNYAANHSSATSSYYSYPDTFFNEWAFTTLAPDTCDLYVRDFANDSGAVPSMLVLNNSSTSPSSPDIYLRNTNDGFDNQTNQQPDFNNSQAYLYTRVHNRGLNEFMGGGVYIHAYWFVPSSYGFGGQWLSVSNYGLIGEKEIQDCIEERNNSIQLITWQIPSGFGSLVTSSLGYLVELSEESTSHVQNLSGFNQLYSNAANSNDITYRKILFGNITPFQSMYSVDLTKGDDENFIYEILSESGNENCTIEDNGDMLHVEINMEANSPDVQIYHVVQKSDLTGKLEDELTIQLDRVSASDSTVHEEETSSNSILSLSKDQSQTSLIVSLQNPATNNTQICIEYVTTSVSTQNYNLNEGQSEITIPVNTLTDGFYNVTLKINGLSVDSKKIY